MNESTVIALGFFDGVHIGHGELLKMAVRRASERGCNHAPPQDAPRDIFDFLALSEARDGVLTSKRNFFSV
mgnify:CR=1 FL=1